MQRERPSSESTTLRDRPFAERLTAARRLISLVPPRQDIPLSLIDQILAASREAVGINAGVGRTLAVIDPDRGWRLYGGTPTTNVRAVLLAAVLGCQPCPHLCKRGPQPGFARLPLRRVDCRACVATLHRPPADNEDQCDVCGQHGIDWFVPFSVAIGPLVVGGDACRACVTVLGFPDDSKPLGGAS